ncbi:MAG: ATP-binding protein [Candidatus Cryptobacteroides sp.]
MAEQNGKVEAPVFSTGLLDRLGVGMWALEIVEGKKPRMYADSVMSRLLGCPQGLTPEEVYERWSAGVNEKASVLLNNNLDRMASGVISEVQYPWNHPDGSRRTIRCGGTRDWSFTEGLRCEGTHRDVTNISHIDDEWRRRSVMLKSYFNYYNSRDALVILLVNLQNDRYATIKSSKEIEDRLPLNEEGSFSDYISRFVEVFATDLQSDKVLNFSDYAFLDHHFSNSPVYRQHFSAADEKGNTKWYRMTANRLNNNDMVVSLEDSTIRISENILMNTISNRLIGGFILNLELDSISVVKLTPFFNYLDDNTEPLTIPLGVELLCPHIDAEFREGWLHFASMENLLNVYNSQKRADYPFKAIYAGEHTWIRTTLYAVDTKMCKDPSLVLAFRKYSKDELDEVSQNEELLHQKEKLERDFRLINGIASQYISLKVVRTDGKFVVIFKDLDPSYGWSGRIYGNFWESFSSLLKDHCHPDDYQRMMYFSEKENIISMMRGRRRHVERFRFHLKDGSYIWMDLVLIRFDSNLDTDLTEFAYALANVDVEVHREKEYAQALEQAKISKEESRLKTQFVNNISHDIRTPLNAVIGYSQLLTLAGDSLTEAERAEYVNYIETSGELLTMLIDDILSISDIEHDILKLRMSDSSCNLICRKAVSCCMMRVPTGVKLYFTTEYDDSFTIKTDSNRVQQILINMISNSCKATVEGEIRVHCAPSSKDGFVDFVVTDTGCGVAPEKAEEIFNRFVSVDNNDSGAGHGLGLDICIKVSQRMGGFIWLDQSYSGGARFVLTLPIGNDCA